jgi:hypothetical protein
MKHPDLHPDHPLRAFVIDAFKERRAHDGSSLAYALSGGYTHGSSDHCSLQNAYLAVARHVLASMAAHGQLKVLPDGWHTLPD